MSQNQVHPQSGPGQPIIHQPQQQYQQQPPQYQQQPPQTQQQPPQYQQQPQQYQQQPQQYQQTQNPQQPEYQQQQQQQPEYQQQQQQQPQYQQNGTDGPAELQGLASLNHVKVEQEASALKFIGIGKQNTKYKVLTINDQLLYTVGKHTIRGTNGMFQMSLLDTNGQEVMRTSRSDVYSNMPCCAALQSNIFTIETPPGQTKGNINRVFSLTSIEYNVESGNGKLMFKIVSQNSVFLGGGGRETVFQIVQEDDKQKVGSINCQQGGFLRGATTSNSGFEVVFYSNLGVEQKALILACGFFIEATYYEKQRRQKRRR